MLSKAYNPREVEPDILDRWNEADAFHAEPDGSTVNGASPGDGRPYCIVIPPPNVTAALHMGHGLNNTLQDILVRFHRMRGFNTLWMPGTDHAGIATQTVVDKRLVAEGEPSLKDYKKLEAEGRNGRERFVEKVQAWSDEYEQRITNQLKKMGCSCDFKRQAFTMDDVRARAVREAFFELFKAGLIYRGKRLVNWDPVTQTALADDEVEMREVDGHFWYMKYPVVEKVDEGTQGGAFARTRRRLSPGFTETGQFVTVATTRPETMLGDTAVAMNPSDPRAAGLRGKFVRLPIVNRIIPIIEDDYVTPPDPDSSDARARYSSGFLKVTPAHDPNDYEIGERFNLETINVMAPDGSISRDHGWPDDDWDQTRHDDVLDNLLGLDRYEAREAIVDWFRENKLLEDVKPYRHSVGHSYRSHVPVEPYLSDQWYVKVTDERLAGAALRAMAQRDGDGDERNDRAGAEASSEDWEGKLTFTPPRYAKTFETWHENIRDWCISRQLWWGHRIPVWTKDGEERFEHESAACRLADGRTYVCLQHNDDRLIQELESRGLTRDPDVLDTWFSSALWPISTLGWPDETAELQTWNPSNCLSTAREIITLWVSRMVMFNLFFRERLPFTDVFIHAMIQDGQGRKMSKSLGNGVDPLDIIHSHGADAMRFTLTKMTTHTQDVRLPVELDERTGRNTSPKFDEGRNFANKLWNATRFALGHLEGGTEAPVEDVSTQAASLPSRWILSRLAEAVKTATEAIERYDFNTYAQSMYDFVWRDFCDWYLEAIKPTVEQDAQERVVLASVLDAILRLLHPMMPFITEKLWEALDEVRRRQRADAAGAGREAVVPGEAGEADRTLLIKAAWPVPETFAALSDEPAERQFELVRTLVSMIREVRSDHQLPPRETVDVSLRLDAAHLAALDDAVALVADLARATIVATGSDVTPPDDAAAAVRPGVEVYLHGLLDKAQETERLNKRLAEVEKSIKQLEGRLSNKGYVEKAPEHLVQETREQLAAAEAEADKLRGQLQALEV